MRRSTWDSLRVEENDGIRPRPSVMPAVDAPDAGGIAFPELELLLTGLVDTPHCLGVEITVFDPDYDPDGSYAAEIVSTLAAIACTGIRVPRKTGWPVIIAESVTAIDRAARRRHRPFATLRRAKAMSIVIDPSGSRRKSAFNPRTVISRIILRRVPSWTGARSFSSRRATSPPPSPSWSRA